VQILRHVLEPGDSIHQPVNMIMGRFGFPFKDPGFYRIEASYTNIDGTTAAAVMQLYVKPAASAEDMRTISELFHARIGRALYVGGTRMLEDVNAKLDWVRHRLGERHPATYYLTAVRYMPQATPMKIVDPQSKKLRVLEADPDRVARQLAPIITDEEAATEALGRAAYREVAQVYARAVAQVKARGEHRRAQASNNGTSLLKRSGGVSSVVTTAKAHADRK
jgi:hypothetical protein